MDKLDRLQANPDNPRTITPEKAKALKRALARFGDLGGIVLNRRTGKLVTGHQRSEALRQGPHQAIHILIEHPAPTQTGTVAEGYVSVDGERYTYREVDWSPATAKAAALAANQHAGSWDITGLTAWLGELKASDFEMDLTLFSSAELTPYLPEVPEIEPARKASEAPAYVASEGEDFDLETGEVVVDVHKPDLQAAPSQTRLSKSVQLHFDQAAHAKFVEVTDALQQVYKTAGLSETVLEAVKRAGISAALK